MIAFNLKKNNRLASFRLLDSLDICHLAVSLGGTETLIEHPRSMTHSDMSKHDLDRAKIGEGMIRLSVGLESSEDIVKDIFEGLKNV